MRPKVGPEARGLVRSTACLLAAATLMASPAPAGPPNIVVIICDDLGYGDLGCYGHPTIRTPNLDRMAREGQRWTSFYAAASVCTPSRAALLTGRLAIRSGMTSNERGVLFPDSTGGLPESEVTLAELLKGAGFATACVGKWHLGHLPRCLPTRHGFDRYFGIPYSNDMDRDPVLPEGRGPVMDPRIESFRVPLLRGEREVERPADQRTLTRRYTEEAIRFVEENRDRPFFLYLAHAMPHVPLFRSEEFAGRSERGLYGDVVEELDASTGRLLDALRRLGLEERTVVFFTSDNGPWLEYGTQGGSAGLLRDGKGTPWEGGHRVPMLARWPGRIPADSTARGLGCGTDLFVTVARLAGAEVPRDRAIDGVDLGPALLGEGASPREMMFYYRGAELSAVRRGSYKAHLLAWEGRGSEMKAQRRERPLLYHLGHDPGERFDVAARHPGVVAELVAAASAHRATVEPAEDQLRGRLGRPAGGTR